jgi:hypothetical protein
MSQESDLLTSLQEMRRKQRAFLDSLPDCWQKTAVEYYTNFGRAIDTATPDTVVAVIEDLIRRSENDSEYMLGFQVLGGKEPDL